MMDVFSDYRSLLFGIAYRMLGRVADAEDVVQETYLRWHRQDVSAIDSPKAWLIATTTRLSIDQLRSAQRQREEYVGVWLPEPLVAPDLNSPSDSAALADSLGMAFMMMLETLSPVERAVFLLREAFDYDYAEIARIVEKSEANCRQIVTRARGQLARRDKAEAAPVTQAEPIVQRFLAACRSGSLEELLAMLTDDAVLYTDGGGRVKAARRPICSADHVARFFLGIRERSLVGADIRFVVVNGELGILARNPAGRVWVSTFVLKGERIKAIYSVSNPDKLQRLPEFAALPPDPI